MVDKLKLQEDLKLIREKSPLVHNITNYVVMNNTAGDPEYLVEVIMNGEPVWSSYMKIAAQEKRVWVWEK